MKSGWNDPDCAQIIRELNIVSVSAESHGLTFQFTFNFTATLLSTLLLASPSQSNAAVLWGRWERKRGGGRGEQIYRQGGGRRG